MVRALLLIGLLAATLAPGADAVVVAPPKPVPAPVTPPPTSAEGYHFTVKASRLYAYSLKQTVAWGSAGDQLTYTSSLTWKFSLTVVEATPERALLEVIITRVQATHEGPSSRRQVDSVAKEGQEQLDDPLLGHLLALNGSVLGIVVAPATGVVSEVRGGDAIVARINKRSPAVIPGEAPPLDAAARAAYSNEALVRIWGQMLALPTPGTTRVPLGPPLGGELERQWEGSSYTLRLPAGGDHLTATLMQDPTPVTAVLSDLTGRGTTSLKDGLPLAGKGDLAFQLRFQALTQPVVQSHTLQWELTPLRDLTPLP